MKQINNNYRKAILVIVSILLSIFLYQKSFGINIIISSILVYSSIFIYKREAYNNTIVKVISVLFLIASILVFSIQSNLSIINYFVTLFIFIGYVSSPKTSIYVSFLNGVFSFFIAMFLRFLEKQDTPTTEAPIEKKETDYAYIIKLIGLPLLLIIVFTLLYKNVSPVFNDLVNKIDLSFINIGWIIFTIINYYIINNITNPIQLEPVTKEDIGINNNLNENILSTDNSELVKETTIGMVLIGSLNVLILLFIATDLVYLLSENSNQGVILSQAVHKGVNALITSIILAISIILYFFRGSLNFLKKSIPLKKLAYVWILLNIAVVAITFYKNLLYVQNLGLTYKRIGVFVYLTLAVIGLISTYIKVMKAKNLWYLLRFNTTVMCCFLFLASFVNWDILITQHNLKQQKHTSIDYLISLSDRNSTPLYLYAIENKKLISNIQWKKIRKKYLNHKDVLKNRTWQEQSLENFTTYEND